MEDNSEDISQQQQYNVSTTESTVITDTSLLSDMIISSATSSIVNVAKEAMNNDLQQQSVVSIGDLVQPSQTTFSTSISPEIVSVASAEAIPSQHDGEGSGVEGGVTLSPTVKQVKHRPTFTEEQISSMDTIFKQRQYLTPIERESVASTVGLSPQQVRVWFQNRRQKAKQFLAYKQHQQNGQDVAQNEEETSSDGVTDIASILSKLQKQSTPSVDPQLLQLVLPPNKTSTPDNREPSPQDKVGGESTNTILIGQPVTDSTQSPTSLSTAIPSNGTIPVNPHSLLCLAPLLMSSNSNKPNDDDNTGQVTSLTTPSSTVTLSALQLLQCISSTAKMMTTQPPAVAVGTGLNKKEPNPLKAESPVPVEETMNDSCTGDDISMSEAKEQGEDTKEGVVQGAGPGNTQLKTPPISSGILSNEVLQQILQASIDKSKLQATPTSSGGPVTPTLPPSLSLSLTSTAAERPARKKRQVFSGQQIAEMEKHFEVSPYIDNKDREALAARIGLGPDQVKVWFQNRRTKKSRLSWRQQTKENQQQQS